MHRTILAVVVLTLASDAFASSAFHPSGSSLTNGAVSFGNHLISQSNNPASMEWAMSHRKHRWAFGLLNSLGVDVEIGQVDNFIDDLDRLSQELDRNDLTLDDAQNIIDEFQDVLVTMGEVGYLTAGAGVYLPGMPLAFRHKDFGTLMLDVNVSAQARLNVLDSPIVYNPVSNSLETNSALYVKGARIDEFALSYSRKLRETLFGDVYTGVRAKYFRVGLTKTVLAITDTGGDTASASEDRVNTDFNTSAGFGLDVGAMLVNRHYSLGATVVNINSPTFAYNTVGRHCDQMSADAQNDCNAALSHNDEIDLNETHTFNAQMRLDGALYTRSKHWALMTSMDVNGVNDPVGNQIQWLVVSGAYLSPNRWVPSARIGYRANMTGSRMRYLTLGTSLFRVLHLDVAYGLQSVQIDGSSLPRGAAFNLGLEFGF